MNLAEHIASRKLSSEVISKRSGVDIARLNEIVKGSEATLSEIRSIAKAIRIPLSALIDTEPAEPVRALFRRTLENSDTEFSAEVTTVSSQIRDALIFAREIRANSNWLSIFRDHNPQVDAAEEIAFLFRKAFAGLDNNVSFENLPQVLQELGVFILFSRDPSIEGVSALVEGYSLVIVSARRFKPRMLFTLAHELGHLVAHHNDQNSGYVHFDHEADFDRLISHPQGNEEKFADAFASALLLPRPGVLLALREIRGQLGAKGPLGDIEISWLAHLYHVSFEVAARRCEDLDLLPKHGARALYQVILDNHKNPERRASELGIPPRPDISIDVSPALLQEAALKIRAGEMSVGRAAELLNVPISYLLIANADIA